MTSTVPATYPPLSIGNVFPGKDINAEDWLTISERSNWLYSRQVEIVPGFVELLETGSGPSETQVNDAGRDLDTWQAVFVPTRDTSEFSLYVYGVYFNFAAVVARITGSTTATSGTLVASRPSSPAAWAVGTTALTPPTPPGLLVASVFFASTDPGLDVALVNEFLITGAVLTTL